MPRQRRGITKQLKAEPENIRYLKTLCSRLEALSADLRREENRREKLFLAQTDDIVLASSARMIGALSDEIKTLKQRIDDHIDQDSKLKKDNELLKTIPGIGDVSAYTMQTALGGRMFHSAKQVASYLGLVPKHRESGRCVVKQR